jgi:hypothetical protein
VAALARRHCDGTMKAVCTTAAAAAAAAAATGTANILPYQPQF